MGRTLRTICVGPRCVVRPVPGGYFCALCWERVPGEIQDLVFDTWEPDDMPEPHRRAIAAAVRSLERLPLD